MTEESVELLFTLEYPEMIVGRSYFVKRPKKSLKIPTIGKLISSAIQTIIDAKPGLIAEGMNVLISNQRSLDVVLRYILSVSASK